MFCKRFTEYFWNMFLWCLIWGNCSLSMFNVHAMLSRINNSQCLLLEIGPRLQKCDVLGHYFVVSERILTWHDFMSSIKLDWWVSSVGWEFSLSNTQNWIYMHDYFTVTVIWWGPAPNIAPIPFSTSIFHLFVPKSHWLLKKNFRIL